MSIWIGNFDVVYILFWASIFGSWIAIARYGKAATKMLDTQTRLNNTIISVNENNNSVLDRHWEAFRTQLEDIREQYEKSSKKAIAFYRQHHGHDPGVFENMCPICIKEKAELLTVEMINYRPTEKDVRQAKVTAGAYEGETVYVIGTDIDLWGKSVWDMEGNVAAHDFGVRAVNEGIPTTGTCYCCNVQGLSKVIHESQLQFLEEGEAGE